jgi:Flp pilus assembly protein TadD
MAVTEAVEIAPAAKRRRLGRLLLAVPLAAVVLAAAWAWWSDSQYKAAMAEIESEIVAGRYAIACKNLDKLLAWKTDSNGGITYLLGSCELARGRSQAASEAWGRVAPGSAFSERAIRGRLRLLYESGQFAAAERLILDAARDPRNDGTSLLVMLVPLFGDLGRSDEAERLIEDRWEHLNQIGEGALEPAIKLVRQHVELTLKPSTVDAVRTILERAAKLAPDDDRVWLGRANLAIRAGTLDQAEQWLAACEKRRPDDPAVGLARLSWGMAADREDVVQQAIHHRSADLLSKPRRHQVNAWLARRHGDLATERRELELLVKADPAAILALDRLAELAEKDSQPAFAAQYRGKKSEIDGQRERYLKLHDRTQPIRDAVELARLAEQLGRPFEARVFLSIAISEDPHRADLRRDLERLSRLRRPEPADPTAN